MVAVYDPLHSPDTGQSFVPSLDVARRFAREALDKAAQANIHDPAELLNAAGDLHYVLRAVLAALDAEEGRTL